MDIDLGTLSFALLLTPPGILVAGLVVRQFVQVIKTTFPGIDAKVSGALQSFVVSALLYILTAIATITPESPPDFYLIVFTAWLTVAGTAVGADSVARHVATKDLKGMTVDDPVPPDIEDVPPAP